ncbi:MAG: hypothetical protein AAEJ04_01455 [Planctomycetota bacterium]
MLFQFADFRSDPGRWLLVGFLSGFLGLVSGCTILPVSGGSQTGVVHVFEAKEKPSEVGVGFAGYWFRDQQLGAFVHLQASYSGSVTGVHYSDLPAEGAGDPITAVEKNGALLAIGPTWKVNEELVVYGGLGVGTSSKWTERFDADLELSPNGYYHYEGDRDVELHATLGSLLQLGGGWVMDLGYGSYSDALHVGFGFSY